MTERNEVTERDESRIEPLLELLLSDPEVVAWLEPRAADEDEPPRAA